MPMVTIFAILVFLGFGENGLATEGVNEVGEADINQANGEHEGEDNGEESNGVKEFVHDGDIVGDSWKNVNRRMRYGGGSIPRRFRDDF